MTVQNIAPSSSCAANGNIISLAAGIASVQSTIVATSTEVPARVAGIKTISKTAQIVPQGRETKNVYKLAAANVITSSSSILSLVNTNSIASSQTPIGSIASLERFLDSLYGAIYGSSVLAISRVAIPSAVQSVGNIVSSGIIVQKSLFKKLSGSSIPSSTLNANGVQTQLVSIAGSVTPTSSVSSEQINRTLLDSFLYWLRHHR
jgi:hypothetical protein